MTNKLQEFLAPINNSYENKDVLINKAVEAIENRDVFVFGFSGKKAAGKDTMANLFMEKFHSLGKPAQDVPSSLAIRSEATEIFADIQRWANSPDSSESDFVSSLAERQDITVAQVRYIMNTVSPLINAGSPALDGWDRANEVTAVLQYLGDEVRLPKDGLYWARKALWSIAVNASNGVSSFNPSLRFLHDADTLKDIGGYLIRLNIDPVKQAERLLGRDGVVVPPETLNHVSETSLDAYKGFDAIYDSGETSAEQLFKTVWADWAKTVGHNSRI